MSATLGRARSLPDSRAMNPWGAIQKSRSSSANHAAFW
jgi:hypothetical protein